MSFPVLIPMRFRSRYSLLDAMSREIAAAFDRRGCRVNPPGEPPDEPGLLLYFNFLNDVSDIHPAIRAPGSSYAVIQFLVDHPFALNERQMDETARLPNFRLLLPCIDGAHMLRLRWPSLLHAHCPHGVSPAALAEPHAIAPSHADPDRRPDGVLVTGTIQSEAELDDQEAALPAALRPHARDLAALLEAFPHMPVEQGLDLTLGTANIPPGQWGMAAAVVRHAVARANRTRRTRLLAELQGLPVVVLGGEAWEPFCTGTIERREPVDYAEMPAALMRARVCLALGPTQFTHTFSERLLLSLAAGCATIADDRFLIRRHFAARRDGAVAPLANTPGPGVDAAAPVCELFDPAAPGSLRPIAEHLLASPGDRSALGAAGRAAVAAGHLWDHRLELMTEVAGAAIANRPTAPA